MPNSSLNAEATAPSARVVAVIGSYRKGGITDRLVDEMLEVVAADGHRVRKIYLDEVPIAFCRNCRSCTQDSGGFRGLCDLQDGLQELLKTLDQADGLILASPVNFFTVTALTKRFVERLVCCAYWPWGKWSPGLRRTDSRQVAVLVSSCAMPALLGRWATNALRVLKSAAVALGARPVGSLFVGMVARSEHQPLSARSCRRARRLARTLVKSCSAENSLLER